MVLEPLGQSLASIGCSVQNLAEIWAMKWPVVQSWMWAADFIAELRTGKVKQKAALLPLRAHFQGLSPCLIFDFVDL